MTDQSSRKITSFHPPQRTLMGPGPTEIHPRVLTTMSQPAIGYLDPVFVEMMEELKIAAALRRTRPRIRSRSRSPVRARSAWSTASSTWWRPGDKVIVCRNGVFGGRMIENVERCGGVAVVVDDEWGEPVDPQKVEDALEGQSATRRSSPSCTPRPRPARSPTRRRWRRSRTSTTRS